MEVLSLLAVTARPGDELPVAGTLAHLSEAGVHVALACATYGEHTPPAPQHEEGNAPPRAVEQEHDLRCACAKLGVKEVHLLGYHDSGPRGEVDDVHALSRASACDVVRRLVHLIRTVRPQVMLTVEPNGIDRHTDRMAISTLAAQAFGAAGDPAEFPPNGGPELYAPAKLYYYGLPEGLLALAGLPGPGSPEAEFKARRDVAPQVEQKLDAARCYRHGVEGPMGKLLQIDPRERAHLLSVEFLTLAQPQPAADDAFDPNLFAGIP